MTSRLVASFGERWVSQSASMFWTVVLMVLVTVTLEVHSAVDHWESADVMEIAMHARLRNAHFKCLMDQAKCTKEAADLKRFLPEVLKNDCSDCSEKSKENISKVIEYILVEHPDMYKQLEERYDPRGVIRKRYQMDRDRGSQCSIFAVCHSPVDYNSVSSSVVFGF